MLKLALDLGLKQVIFSATDNGACMLQADETAPKALFPNSTIHVTMPGHGEAYGEPFEEVFVTGVVFTGQAQERGDT